MHLVNPTTLVAPSAPPQPRSLVIGAIGQERAIIEQQLRDLTELVGVATDGAEGRKFATELAADVVLVNLGAHADAMMETARLLAQVDGRTVVVTARDRDPELIVRAMRAGARDFAYLEQVGDVRRAVAALRLTKPAAPAHRGRLIAVFAAKGGCGGTTIATNLARALHHATDRTILVDADLQRGDALVFLDVTSGFGWHDLLRELPRLDDELLERSLVRHGSGLRVLAETGSVEDAEAITPVDLARALQRLLDHADHVVVDGLHDFSDGSLAVLDLADTVLLTLTQDVPALKNAARTLAVFRRLGYGPDKVKIVVNRYLKRNKLGLDTIADALGVPIDATIDNDFPTVHQAIEEGKLLVDTAPRAHVTRDVQALAKTLETIEHTPRRAVGASKGMI